jgi:flagellar biosynthesis protein FlhG
MVDTDLGMADLNLLLGVAPEKSLLDALSGTPVEDVLISAHGIALLPALNGSYLLSTIGPSAQRRVIDLVNTLAERFDCLVVDIAAGIGQVQTTFAGATSDAIVVEPRAAVDGRRLRLPQDARDQQARHAASV